MKLEFNPGTGVLVASLMLLTACGGGGDFDDRGDPPANRAPVANAGADIAADELVLVSLSGSGSDPDGDALTYSWSQTSGRSVSITNSDMAAASFMAPDVTAGSPETLTFRLTVSDGTLSSTDDIDVVVSQNQFLAGRLFYELPQPNPGCRGLDFSNILEKPARGMTVLLLDAANNVLDTTTTSYDGSYRFSPVPPSTDVRIRVRAELVQSGTQSGCAGTRQCRGIGHDAHHTRRPVKILFKQTAGHSGRDRHQQLGIAERRCDARHSCWHDLWLDRQHDQVAVLHHFSGIAAAADAVTLR